MIAISSIRDVVCITTAHITVSVTVRVVRYIDVMATTECRAVGGMAVDSMGVGVDDRVLGLLVNRE